MAEATAPAADTTAAPPVVPTGDAAPANGAPPVPPVPEFAAQLARIAEREAAHRHAAEEFERQRQAFDGTRKTLETEAEYAKRIRAISADPVALLREFKIAPQKLLELAAQGDGGAPSEVLQELDKLRAQQAEVAKQVEAQKQAADQARQSQELAKYHGVASALLDKGGKRWQLARHDGLTPEYLVNAAIMKVKAERIHVTGPEHEQRIFEEIADKAQAYAEKQAASRRELDWYKEKFAPPPPQTNGKPPAPTLTNATVTRIPPKREGRWDPKAHREQLMARHPEVFGNTDTRERVKDALAANPPPVLPRR